MSNVINMVDHFIKKKILNKLLRAKKKLDLKDEANNLDNYCLEEKPKPIIFIVNDEE